MRLTLALSFRRFRERYYLKNAKINWRKHGKKMLVRELCFADETKERLQGIEVEDTFTSTRYRDTLLREIDYIDDSWKPPVDLAKFLPKEELEDEVLAFQPKSLFSLGERQAAVLSKCVVIHGAPPELSHLDVELPPETVGTLERAIMRANVWAPDENRLPRRFVPELPIWKAKPEYGILPKNQVRYLLTDLLRFAEFLSPCGPGFRLTTRDTVLPSSFLRSGQCIHLEGALELAVFAREPLPLLARDGDEAMTVACNAALPDLHPVSPLVDLKASRKYTRPEVGLANVPTVFPHLHLGVVNLSELPYRWNYFAEPEAQFAEQQQKNAIGIMSALGLALTSARNQSLIGADGRLTRPVTSQVICCDGVNFEFVRFQLNTLDLGSTEGVKNLAWVDDGHALFQKKIPRRARLRNTTFHDLNLDVFRRFLTAFRFGCDLNE